MFKSFGFSFLILGLILIGNLKINKVEKNFIIGLITVFSFFYYIAKGVINV